MRAPGTTKRDLVVLVPRQGGAPPPSKEVLKRAAAIARSKGKRLLTKPVVKEESTYDEMVSVIAVRALNTTLISSSRKAPQTGTVCF